MTDVAFEARHYSAAIISVLSADTVEIRSGAHLEERVREEEHSQRNKVLLIIYAQITLHIIQLL